MLVTSFINSPVWASVVSIAGAVLISLVGVMTRILGKVNSMDDKLKEIANDVNEIRNDKNIVRWSDIAWTRRLGRGRHGV